MSNEDRIKILEAELNDARFEKQRLAKELDEANSRAKEARVLRSKLNMISQMLCYGRDIDSIKTVLDIHQ